MAGKPFVPFAAKVSQSVFDAVRQQLLVAGAEVKIAAQISITKGAASDKKHVPSKPGDPPNNDTGELADGILVVPVKEGEAEVHVVAPAPYAQHLEFGTSRMAARPFLRPPLAETEPKVRKLIAEAVSAGVKRATK